MVAQEIFHRLLSRLEHGGVTVTYPDGSRHDYGPAAPYFGMVFKTPGAIRKILVNQSLGLGEGYADGSIEINGSIDQIIRLVWENQAMFNHFSLARVTNKNQKNVKQSQARQVQHHYDLGNNFYKLWLDTSMTYSCAYFTKPTDSLEVAQLHKVEHLLRKLQLEPGQRVLDIGSGWGTLLITAAAEYGVHGLGITLSREQHKHSVARAKAEGLEKQIEFKLVNFHDLPAEPKYDRIISVGMFEHVGQKNHQAYYQTVQKLLVPGGISVLHTISAQTEAKMDPWIDKYIFPGGYLPAIREVVSAMPSHNLRLLDYESLRIHYAMTLDEWLHRLDEHKDEVIQMYDEKFYRLWRFYLACSSGSFRYGPLDLSQFVFSNGANNDLPLTREHLYK